MQRYKIIFGGTMGAGKTQAIRSLSEIDVVSTEAVNHDFESHSKLMTTVGIDYGEITLGEDMKIGLYGTPGQNRFNFVWPIVAQGALGVVILVDHTAAQPLADLKDYLDAFEKVSSEIVIGVTHVDRRSERSMAMYRDFLSQRQRHYPLFSIDARERSDVLLLVETIVARLESRMLLSA